MKRRILCMGLLLLVLKTVHAQHPLKTPSKDTTQKVQPIASLADTTNPKQKDSLRLQTSGENSAKKDSTGPIDLFEEMRVAQLSQDKSMHGERSVVKTLPHTGVKNSEHKQPATALKGIDSLSWPTMQDSLLQKDTIQSIFTRPVVSDTSSRPVVDSSNLQQGLEGLFNSTEIAQISGNQNTTSIHKDSASSLKDSLLAPTTAVAAQAQVKAPALHQATDTTAAFADTQNGVQAALQAVKGEPLFVIDSILPPPQNTPFTALFQPYKAFDKSTQISSTTSLNILQQQVDYKTSADFTTRYERTAKNAANFKFDVSVIKLNTEVETMGVQLQYDSNQAADSTSSFAKPLFDIVGKKTFLEVDSTGQIMAVDSSELGRQISQVLSGLSMSGGDFEVGSNLGLLLSKVGPFTTGDHWTDTVRHGDNQRLTTYTIKSVVDGSLLVLISGSVRQQGEIKSDGAVFKTQFEGTQQGKLYVDEQTLLVQSRDITFNMKGSVQFNGQLLPASATSKIHEKVTHN